MDNILPPFKTFSIDDERNKALLWYPETAACKSAEISLSSVPHVSKAHSYERDILPPNERRCRREYDDPKLSPLGESERCLFYKLLRNVAVVLM